MLVLMPTQKDAERTLAAFGDIGIHCIACANLNEMCREILEGAGAALLIEEALLADRTGCLKTTVHSRGSLAGFPLIVLTREGRKHIQLPDEIDLNVTLVERPVRMVTLKSVVNTALRHRRRQYELYAALDELERANRELEDRVKQRTAKLAETVHELEAYSYSISHDMRAPLRAMQAYAKSLTDELGPQLNATHKHYLTRITAAANRLDKFITDVLSYSRLSRAELDLKPVDLDRLVPEITSHYPALEKAQITIAEQLGTVTAAETLLTQAIANLLTNAAKFVKPGDTPRIRIWSERLKGTLPGADESSHAEASTRPFIRLHIQDAGIGIAPKDQERIFGIFNRVHSEKEYEGTGIGLSIVRKAVERMSGRVGLKSELGKGTTFWIDLPAA